MASDAADESELLAEAAGWLSLLLEAPLDAAQQQALAQWRGRSKAHERAWQRAELLLQRLQSLPAAPARQLLARGPSRGQPRGGRRTLIGAAAGLLLAGPLAYGLWREGNDEAVGARHATGVGERRTVRLPDGGEMVLNADSVVGVDYQQAWRRLMLERGEIYVRTAPDQRQPARPFLVQTALGRLQALGTRFSVRLLPGAAGATELSVYEGAVAVMPTAQGGDADAVRVDAGHRVRLLRDRVLAQPYRGEGELAWRQGLLVADAWSVAEWSQALMRYNPGWRIDSAAPIAALQISGVFPIDDPQLALQMLARTHRLQLQQHGQVVTLTR